ncbi:MAG: CoA transferase [Chloroflexi bacterium]|nr:CoA transferase [Chloroflexota bacterium]
MLSPYTVLDLTDDHGELAGMMLGDLGANVIKVEPPEGSTSRRMGPFIDDLVNGGQTASQSQEASLHYYAFNRNKRGIILDLEAKAGREALLKLAETADFVIESAPPGRMAELGLGFDSLKAVNPRIIYVAITAFGQDGPYSGMAASDLTLAAMAGPMSLQGVPERAPVRISVPQAWLHASSEAAVAALTAHALMIRTGEGQFVDVSAQAAMVWTMLHGMSAHAIQGYDFNREGSDVQLGPVTLPVVYECADGHVVLITSGAVLTKMVHWWVEEGIVPADWIDAEDWPTYERRLLYLEPMNKDLNQVVDAARRYVANKTKQELLELGLREGVTLAPVSNMENLVRFRHLEDREYWLSAPLPGGGETTAPGAFVKLSETPMSVRHRPPHLGQHNQEVLGGTLGLSDSQIASAAGR